MSNVVMTKPPTAASLRTLVVSDATVSAREVKPDATLVKECVMVPRNTAASELISTPVTVTAAPPLAIVATSARMQRQRDAR